MNALATLLPRIVRDLDGVDPALEGELVDALLDTLHGRVGATGANVELFNQVRRQGHAACAATQCVKGVRGMVGQHRRRCVTMHCAAAPPPVCRHRRPLAAPPTAPWPAPQMVPLIGNEAGALGGSGEERAAALLRLDEKARKLAESQDAEIRALKYCIYPLRFCLDVLVARSARTLIDDGVRRGAAVDCVHLPAFCLSDVQQVQRLSCTAGPVCLAPLPRPTNSQLALRADLSFPPSCLAAQMWPSAARLLPTGSPV